MSNTADTRLWGASVKAPIDRTRCSACATPFAGRPFCPADGTLAATGPFTIGDRYLVEAPLGAGGSALVFAARHLVLGRSVAVKILKPELASRPVDAQRFLREARLASQLSHENIVAITDFGTDEKLDASFLVMEHLVGRSLFDLIAASGPLEWRAAAPILLQLARALVAAHAAGVMHRDLSPRNVFLIDSSGQQNVVKLCDFGLSRQTSGSDRLTHSGDFLGTPAYMAPEQIRGELDQDQRVDLYGFGVTAYEILTGTLPHQGETPVALIASKLTDEPIPLASRRPLTDVPARIAPLIMRCLAADAAERPATAAEIERELMEALVDGALGRGSGHELAIRSSPAPGAAIAPTQLAHAALSSVERPIDYIGQSAGNHRIVRHIATGGGAGSVYLAEHNVLRTKVAVKVLRPEYAAVSEMVRRFITEAQTASQLGSPHIPRYLDFGFLGSGEPFAVMEFLEGEVLRDYMTRRGPLPISETAELVAQVARVMAQAHAAGIVHRDLKPENLFVVAGEDGPVVKVLDFGIAVLTDPTLASSRLTRPGLMMGTPIYCAPEQVAGGVVGPRTDIYALGVTTFELMTGSCPFVGSLAQIVAAKTSAEAPPLSALRKDAPRVVAETVGRMMARDPERRQASMDEVLGDVARWSLASVGVRAVVAVEPSASPPPPQRRGKRAVVLFSLVAALAIAATFVIVGRERPELSPAATPPPTAYPVVAQPTTQSAPQPAIAPAPIEPAPPVVEPLPAPLVSATRRPPRRARKRRAASEPSAVAAPPPSAKPAETIIEDPFVP